MKRVSTCRLCESVSVRKVLELVATPPANAFVSNPNIAQSVYPLNVLMCLTCGCVQLEHTLDPRALFSEYVYVSGTSRSFVEHFERAADSLVRRYCLKPKDLVVSIGSNDGTDLRPYKALGMEVLGVDPAKDIAQAASQSGIPTVCAFFNEEIAKTIGARASLVIANNVFAHADDLREILRGVMLLLKSDGTFVFEVAYLKELLAHGTFDAIYHEHVFYHAVRPLKTFLRRCGFTLLRVEDVDTHGGSIRCHARFGPDYNDFDADESVSVHIYAEDRARIFSLTTWEEFSEALALERTRLLETLDRYEAAVAYGAPAKLTTFCYEMGVGNYLRYVVDDSPKKTGLYTPGVHLLVRSPEVLYTDWPKCILVTAWNFAESILRKHQALIDGGCKFVVPFAREPHT